jgi:phospholipase/lecithinase/hemolysin
MSIRTFAPALHRTTLAVAACAALAAVPATATAAYSSLFVFGDSLSDAAGGNLLPLPPNEGGLPVPAPYNNGRVSNGPVAAEYLGSFLGLSDAQQFHYAVAGARSGTNGSLFPNTGVLSQVAAFSAGGANPSYGSGLFLVWAGANDLRDAFGLANPLPSFEAAITNLSSAVTTLYGLGARHFLLPNMPDIGLTPEVLLNGPLVSGQVSFLTGLFNTQLATAFNGLAATLPGATLAQYDTFAAHQALVAGAPGNGYLNLTNGCLIEVPGAAQAQSPCGESFFVDNIHPTTSVHETLARGMVTAVPEPGTWLMMALGGLAVLGWQRRRTG